MKYFDGSLLQMTFPTNLTIIFYIHVDCDDKIHIITPLCSTLLLQISQLVKSDVAAELTTKLRYTSSITFEFYILLSSSCQLTYY
jgi:hypothetical protein